MVGTTGMMSCHDNRPWLFFFSEFACPFFFVFPNESFVGVRASNGVLFIYLVICRQKLQQFVGNDFMLRLPARKHWCTRTRKMRKLSTMAERSKIIAQRKQVLMEWKWEKHADVHMEKTNLRRKISKRRWCCQHQQQRESEFRVDCTRDIEELWLLYFRGIQRMTELWILESNNWIL